MASRGEQTVVVRDQTDEKEPTDLDEGGPILGGCPSGVSRVVESGDERGGDTDRGEHPGSRRPSRPPSRRGLRLSGAGARIPGSMPDQVS
jgi:hypothetical protein